MPKRRRSTKKTTYRRKRRSRVATVPTVRKIVKRALKPHTQVIRLLETINGNSVSTPFSGFHLNRIVDSVRIFGTGQEDMTNNQAKHVKMEIDLCLKCNTEDDGPTFTGYIVSPYDHLNDALFDGSTGNINLVVNQHYVMHAGIAFVDPKKLKIHRRFKVHFPPQPASGAVGPLYKRKHFVFRPNCIVRNPRGNFGALTCSQKPSQNYYLLIFNDNGLGDLENPTIDATIMNTYIA